MSYTGRLTDGYTDIMNTVYLSIQQEKIVKCTGFELRVGTEGLGCGFGCCRTGDSNGESSYSSSISSAVDSDDGGESCTCKHSIRFNGNSEHKYSIHYCAYLRLGHGHVVWCE